MDGNPMGARTAKVSCWRGLAQLLSVLLGIVAATFHVTVRPGPSSRPPSSNVVETPKVVPAPLVVAAEPREQVKKEPEEVEDDQAEAPAPPVPAILPIDKVALGDAEAALDAASRDRARAEARAADSEKRLAAAANQAALAASTARKLAFRVRDPSAQIARATARGGFLKSDRDKLKAEVATLRTMPRPKATSILTKSPVSRPASSDEYHFELRRNRISFINLDRLLELAKADAQVRIRMSERGGLVTSQVGPVGAFSLSYVLGRAQAGIDELIERQSIRYDLKGWEVMSESEQRGETYEVTRNLISEYSRAVNRLGPGRSVITMWVYPDSFGLYRRLRQELVERGFSVAARPLPEGMTIRGSPMGSISAAQ